MGLLSSLNLLHPELIELLEPLRPLTGSNRVEEPKQQAFERTIEMRRVDWGTT